MNEAPSLAIEQHRAAVREVMLRVDNKKRALAQAIANGEMDANKARERNSAFGASLNPWWSEFLDLTREDQVLALSAETFRGMHWQSLLQSNPFTFAHRDEA